MKLLLDTHAVLWLLGGDDRLGRRALSRLEDPKSELYFSAASAWEIAIKTSLGRLEIAGGSQKFFQTLYEQGIKPLQVIWEHAAAVERLSFHHRDPFDRLLVAQALVEGMPLVSADKTLKKYGVQVIW